MMLYYCMHINDCKKRFIFVKEIDNKKKNFFKLKIILNCWRTNLKWEAIIKSTMLC